MDGCGVVYALHHPARARRLIDHVTKRFGAPAPLLLVDQDVALERSELDLRAATVDGGARGAIRS